MTRRNPAWLGLLGSTLLLAAPAAAETAPVVDERDASMIEENAQESMEYAETLETSEWVNPDTGNRGTITATANFETDDGTYCREFHQTVTIGGREEDAYGTACRMEDGSWEIALNAADEPSAEPVADQPPTVVYRDRVVYVPEPRRTYHRPYLYPFAVSIGIGYHDGYYRYYGKHRHRHGGHYAPYRGSVYRGHSRGIRVSSPYRHGKRYRHSHIRY